MSRATIPASIASGPTVADASTLADVQEIVNAVRDRPAASRSKRSRAQVTKPRSPADLDSDVRLIAAPSIALAAAAEIAGQAGLTPVILGDAIEGESREVGTVMAGIARSVRSHGLPVGAPAILLSGGETTVTIGQGPAGAADATPSSCSALRSRRRVRPASGPSPATATASMARRMPPARS